MMGWGRRGSGGRERRQAGSRTSHGARRCTNSEHLGEGRDKKEGKFIEVRLSRHLVQKCEFEYAIFFFWLRGIEAYHEQMTPKKVAGPGRDLR